MEEVEVVTSAQEETEHPGANWYGETAPETNESLEDGWDNVTEDAPPRPEDAYTIKHLGREYTLTREELIALAQKGKDYDRIRERADRLTLDAMNSGDRGLTTDPGISQRRDRELLDFVSVYRDVTPDDIPQDVWKEVEAGRPLLVAFMCHENASLKAQLEADTTNFANRRRSTGSRSSAGAMQMRGEMELDWYN